MLLTRLRERLRDVMAHGVTRAVAITLMTQAISWGLALVVTFYLPSYLGVLNLGRVALATAFVGTITALISLGTSTVLISEIAKAPSDARSLVRTGVMLRGLVTAVLLFVAAVACWLMGFDHEVNLLIVLTFPAFALQQVTETYLAALNALQEFVKLNSVTLVDKVTYSAFVIALVVVGAPLWTFGAVWIVNAALVNIIARRAFAASMQAIPEAPPTTAIRTTKELAQAGLPFLSSKIFTMIYGEGSTALLMSKLSTVEAIGWLGLAKRFFGAAYVIPMAISNSTLPSLTKVYASGDRERFARMTWIMIGTVILAAMPMAIVLGIFPRELLRVLHYPPSFEGSIPVLRLMGLAVFLWFTQQALATALIASEKQKVFGYVTSIAAILAFPVCGMCILAGEQYLANGAVGAMLGDTLLEIVMLIFYVRALRRDLFPERRAAVATVDAPGEVTERRAAVATIDAAGEVTERVAP
jgi:O-antigen/teichoic acid export membrane protein